MKLGVNIDHIATLRQARRGKEPDPVWAGILAELGGADGITVHLREDRRHIQERDLRLLRETVKGKLNLEMACEEAIIKIALDVRPDQVTLVPEKRQELTTEGGLNVLAKKDTIKRTIKRFREKGITVSLFIEPDEAQIEASKKAGANAIEIHTGRYANLFNTPEEDSAFNAVHEAALIADNMKLQVNAGHGLNYKNVINITKINLLNELNIGHSIISRAVFTGLEEAVREMKSLLPV